MLIVQENPTDTFVEIMQGASFSDASGVQHGWDVTQLWTDEELAAIGVYRVEPAAITDGRVPTGYTFARDGNGTLAQVISYGDLKTDLKAYAAQKRWQKEVGGITVGGIPIATDDRSKMLIGFARVKADKDPSFTTKFKNADGVFSPIDAATIIVISDAVVAHVDACFEIEEEVVAGIESDAIAGAAQIDAAFG